MWVSEDKFVDSVLSYRFVWECQACVYVLTKSSFPSFPLVPPRLPQYVSLTAFMWSLYKPTDFVYCYLYSHGWRMMYWSMGNLSGPVFQKEMDSTSLNSSQLLIAIQLGGGVRFYLAWSCTWVLGIEFRLFDFMAWALPAELSQWSLLFPTLPPFEAGSHCTFGWLRAHYVD